MNQLIHWLEAHDKLAGWAQFFGAIIALLLTYLTAFAPLWRRKRQLRRAAFRLLMNGYEAIESYHRTSAHFLPFPLSVRVAAMTMMTVAEEIDRFPVYELDDQGSRSVARHLLASASTLKGLRLFLDQVANDLEGREATKDDQETIRAFVGGRLQLIRDMLAGVELKRPEWPAAEKPNRK
ncbi:MAG TPA: hypothetical protein VGB70_01795 [Allosphingosinicella sp.]|jgi:hypothetical protein